MNKLSVSYTPTPFEPPKNTYSGPYVRDVLNPEVFAYFSEEFGIIVSNRVNYKIYPKVREVSFIDINTSYEEENIDTYDILYKDSGRWFCVGGVFGSTPIPVPIPNGVKKAYIFNISSNYHIVFVRNEELWHTSKVDDMFSEPTKVNDTMDIRYAGDMFSRVYKIKTEDNGLQVLASIGYDY